MSKDPPACLMTEGGDLINGVQPADDYDYFYLPPVVPTIKPPMIMWGMAVAVLSDRPEVRELVRFLSRSGWGVEGARQPFEPLHPRSTDLERHGMRRPRRPRRHQRLASTPVPGRPGRPRLWELALRRIPVDAARRDLGVRAGNDRLRGDRPGQSRTHPRRPRPRLADDLSVERPTVRGRYRRCINSTRSGPFSDCQAVRSVRLSSLLSVTERYATQQAGQGPGTLWRALPR